MANEKVDFSLKVISPNIGANNITGNGGITTETDLVEINLFLFVKIVRARNLFVHYGHYNFAPYVEVKAGDFHGITLCFGGNSDPEWNQVFALDQDKVETKEMTSVEIVVKDDALRQHGYMGRISLDISDISTRFPTDSALAPQWHVLEDQCGRRGMGELMMSCWIGTQADESFHEAWHLQVGVVQIGSHNIVTTCSRIYIMPRIWCLRFNLIQVEGLMLEADDDPSESSDIFIHATLGNWTFNTKLAKSNNGDAIWNEKDILFAVAEPLNQILFLSVEQGTFTRHKRLGKCGFPVKNAAMIFDGSAPSTKTIDVIQNNEFVGKLSLRICLDGGYHMFDEDPRYSSDVNPTCDSLWRPTVGVFELGILNATGLPAMKPHGRTDAYCVAKYGSKWVRSRTVVNSLSPKWNEQYSSTEAMDIRIGRVRISLSEMETGRIYIYSYPLVELQPSGLKKMGELQLAFKFTCSDMLNVYKMYTLPMLPAQHTSDPLSPIQFYELRKQTIMLVSSHMSKAEPPLRREVVDYMLDSREVVWSMRRCRADFERINAFLRKKPKTLSHVNLHLSHVHTSSVDELEEEFDPMPSKFNDVILRHRYDRLRVAAGRYVTQMGEFAMRVERLQSLLSWHDSLATMFIMILCLIAGIVTLAVPFKAIVFVWLLHLLRHPILLSPFPPFYENWLRRMPSKLDSMI
ncbi:hypothetical protein KIW84_UN0581 [Lathyrus oleraceus]|nr:hypothetical protein KIW84_UN0581 [Pisum sativum]